MENPPRERKASLTAGYYAQHYRPIQWAKYEGVWGSIAHRVPSTPFSMLDMGIGPGWWEEFLTQKGVAPARIVGVDLDEAAIHPARENVTYILGETFTPTETFDWVVCWDAWHLLTEKNLFDRVSPGGLLLISAPPAFSKKLDELTRRRKPARDEKVGHQEISRVAVWF